jgi:hypothetical protein
MRAPWLQSLHLAALLSGGVASWLVQALIFISGAAAIWMTQSDSAVLRQWAPVIGLAGQPFWLYTTIKAQQFGMTLLTLIYTAAWIKGVFALLAG